MSCDKHGWIVPSQCPDCHDELNREKIRREKFENMAAIYFFERRWYAGMSPEYRAQLMKDCWTDARALYSSGYMTQPGPTQLQPPVMP